MFASITIATLVLWVQAESPAREIPVDRFFAAAQLKQVLDDPDPTRGQLVEISTTVAAMMRGSQASARLEALPQDAAAARQVIQSVYQDLSFKPVNEANLPEGFPPLTLVGEIEIKHYPDYRMAIVREVEGKEPAGGMFWQLFFHIQKNQIPMTAPVEMTIEPTPDNDATTRPASMNLSMMGFMYENIRQGKTGTDGNVEVLDVKAMSAVSMGHRGSARGAKIDVAKKQLESWLTTNAPDWHVAGPARILGYNGPSVPPAKQFFEVQLPIQKK